MHSDKIKHDGDKPADGNEANQAPLPREAYTVGWVCALPKEQTAAIAMLDQRHPNIPHMQPPTDTNAYTLGSISGHNIVIACLPKGQIGVASAATVATNMVSTFPAIKIGLMVGIGGGVPSNKVRLGDVVVSTPTGTHPGVVQWDFGKAKEGGNFERTGSLNNLPTILLAALTKLESSHEIEGPKFDEYLEELGRKFPRLAPKYLRSEALRDVLFKADCAHVDADDTSSDEDNAPDTCRHCDRTKAKERKLRDTRIHYGLIASGNQVIKDGVFRDKLNKDLGGHVLCIEMEAAGLMANFPCLVVRGICDYADSHKNKQWQEHAAAVAAACAKEFLAKIELDAIDTEPSARDVLYNIRDTVSSTAFHVDHMHSHLLKEADLKILDWLSPVDYGKQQSDLFSRRHLGTGKWFLDSKPFRIWLESQGKTLFCPGIPGSGKTIIAATVVNFLRNTYQSRTTGLAYVYCNYQRQNDQDIRAFLAIILKQLSQTGLPDSVRSLYDKYADSKETPAIEELIDAIIKVSKSLSNAFFVVDALDECRTTDDCRSRFISHLQRIQAEAGVNIMYTSRHVFEIERLFTTCLKQPIRARGEDVGTFIDSRLQTLLECVKGCDQLRSSIKSTMLALVDGMFLLAQLYLDVLKDTTSVAEVRKVLKQLQHQTSNSARDKEKHHVLEQAYNHAMERIERQTPNFRNLGMRTLSWVTFAERPLTKVELQHALAIEETDIKLDPENVRTIERILSACAGLVTIDERSDAVRLAHFTTQEYLVAKQHIYFPSAQSDITSTCVTYLRSKGLWEHLFRKLPEGFAEVLLEPLISKLQYSRVHKVIVRADHNYPECVQKPIETIGVNHSEKSLVSRYKWDLYEHYSEQCEAVVCQFSLYALSNWGHHARKSFNTQVPPPLSDPSTSRKWVTYIWASGDSDEYGSGWEQLPEYVLDAFGLNVSDRPMQCCMYGTTWPSLNNPRWAVVPIGSKELMGNGGNVTSCDIAEYGKWEWKNVGWIGTGNGKWGFKYDEWKGNKASAILFQKKIVKEGNLNHGENEAICVVMMTMTSRYSPVVVRLSSLENKGGSTLPITPLDVRNL